MKQRVVFEAQEYQKSAVFERHEYTFEGSVDGGWTIRRDSRPWITLPSGYKLIRTRYIIFYMSLLEV
jgi:hypothetical protein